MAAAITGSSCGFCSIADRNKISTARTRFRGRLLQWTCRRHWPMSTKPEIQNGGHQTEMFLIYVLLRIELKNPHNLASFKNQAEVFEI